MDLLRLLCLCGQNPEPAAGTGQKYLQHEGAGPLSASSSPWQDDRHLHTCMQLLYPQLNADSRRALRLTCKTSRDAVDASVQHLTWGRAYATITALALALPALHACAARWPGVVHLSCPLHVLCSLPSIPPTLERLDLSGSLHPAGPTTRGLRPTLSPLAPTLRHLGLHGVLLDWETASALASALAALPSLQSLVFECERNGGNARAGQWNERADALRSLNPAFAKLQHLTHLSLTAPCDIHPSDTWALAEALSVLTRLQSLNLRLGMGRRGAAALASVLGSLGRLTELQLRSNSLGCMGVDDAPGPSQSGCAALSGALRALTCLRRLGMADNGLGAAVSLLLPPPARAPILSLNPSPVHKGGGLPDGLQALDLSNNSLTSHTSTVAVLLARLPSLAELNLNNNRLTDESVALLAPALGDLTGLTHLDVSNNYIGGTGAAALSPALSRLKRLHVLRLQYNPLGGGDGGGAVELLGAMRELTDLRDLRLEYTCLGPHEAPALGKALLNMSALHTLQIQGNFFGEDHAQSQLGTALTRLQHKRSKNAS